MSRIYNSMNIFNYLEISTKYWKKILSPLIPAMNHWGKSSKGDLGVQITIKICSMIFQTNSQVYF